MKQQEQKKINGSLALKSPCIVVIPANAPEQTRKLRVAAYARVSSNSEDQLNSYAAQNAHYTELITSNPEWEFVDVYADKGITGTSAEKREDFQRLLADCRRGRIDRILVKSSSRFARNAKECLEAVRELKALDIGVCFEEQNIDTAKLSGELLIAIFAMIDQEESAATAQRLRWSYRHRMQAGQFITCKAPFGYQLRNGTLQIEKNEAKIIRLIYQRYLQGFNMEEIADEITKYGIPTRDHKIRWKPRSIHYILHNEKYAGNSLLQKKYTTSTLPYHQKQNHGALPQYFYEDSHPPIIDSDTFSRVQELLKAKGSHIPPKSGRLHPFTRIMTCEVCGSIFKRNKSNRAAHWICRTHDKSAQSCPVQQISEEMIVKAFLKLYFKLRNPGFSTLVQLTTDLRTARNSKFLWNPDIIELNAKIADITRQDRLLAQLKQQGLVDPDLFISRRDALAEQLRAVKLEKERLLKSEENPTISQTRVLLETLEAAPEFLDTFDEELFREIVDKIIVESNERLRFRLINGLELTEDIERTVR